MTTATKPKKIVPAPETAMPATVSVLAPTADNPDTVKALTAMEFAEKFSITCASDSAKGQEASQRLNGQIEMLKNKRLELTRPLDALKQKWMDFFNGPTEKYKQAKAIVDRKVVAWQTEQDEIRKAEQRRLDKIAEDERRRLQDIADETARKAHEEAEKKRREAEAAAAAGRQAEADKLNAQAARVEEKALDKAEAFESRAAAVVAPVVQTEAPKVAGSSFRDHWEFEILDYAQINRQFLTADLVKIGKIVQSLHADAVAVVGPGLKVTSRKILASRRA
jgi:hypothetical protein